MPTALSELTADELIMRQQEIGARRAEAEALFKAQQRAVQDELDRRAGEARLNAMLDGVAPSVRAEVLAKLTAANDALVAQEG